MNICVLEHPRVRSKERFNDIANTPLWSCLMGGYAASGLRSAGHDVVLMDTTVTGWDFEKTEQEILKLSPDMLCVNAVYFWENTGLVFDLLANLKKDGFYGHITLFGFFPTLAYAAILENIASVDSVVVGECENTIIELADSLSKHKNLDSIAGLCLRTEHGITISKQRIPEQNIDKFYFPERTNTDDQTVSILASRGCYNHCAFCLVPSFYNDGPLWRGRSPENIYQEISALADKGCKDFYFVDPNFIGPGKKGKERINKLMELIRPLNITFGMETRPNDLDPNILESLVSSGFKTLLLGIESGSTSVLGNLNKGASINSSENAIRICRDAGIEPEVGFLMFVPDSTLEDLEHNFEFLQKNNLLDRLERTANLLSHRQLVLMGTSGYRMFKKQGRLIKAGVLGFEGEVSYQDSRVKWVSDIMIHACLFVLENMEQPNSPIYWRLCENEGERNIELVKANDYLVKLFKRLLTDAAKTSLLPTVLELKQVIEKELLNTINIISFASP
ncbi:MAG: B12-binding domain-containing radical SAM protein [Desulfobacterium sp.]|nr:B12-binding domain-containing radical SAM protein [Desulfobacterium sp.]MBU3949979.1 B12-binding domain-containing radical SAM protein [Pseudomonadota bacterium]MBU4038054.1 B12-binding domain-containing radical SAM protein [Pseudomonadota bacterium]